MTALITLTLAGSDVGPFDLYSDADGYTTPFEIGVSRAVLIAGYTSTAVPDGSTEILARSTGICSRDLYMPIEGAPTTTTTTTSTTSTTSTTTTIIPPTDATINISNYMFDGTIDQINVAAHSTGGGSFPLAPGNITSVTTSYIGTHVVEVFYSGLSVASSITLYDSTGYPTCADVIGSGDQIFYGVVIDGITDVQISCSNGSCF